MRVTSVRRALHTRRAWMPLVLAVITAVAILASSGIARGQEALSVVVRDTIVNPDGTTEIVVNVTGSAKPDLLPAEAFTVTEQGELVDGLEVEPLFEETEQVAVVVGLAIDVSGSMAGEPMEQTKDAAVGLVEDLTARGIMLQLFSFATEVQTLTGATTDAAELTAEIEGLEADGNTALYDAVAVSASTLLGVEAQRNLIVFSDGADTASDSSLADAVAAGADAEIPVTVVALESPDFDLEPLQEIAAGSGGQAVTAADTTELEAAFEQVASDLASQYRLIYTSDLIDPANLDLVVQVAADGAEAEHAFVVANLREGEPEPPPAPRTFAAPEPSPLAGPGVLLAGALAAFTAVLLMAAFLLTSGRTRADRVLDSQLARYVTGGDVRAGRSSHVAAHFRDRAMDLLEAAPRPKGFDERLTRSLEQAAWPLRNGEFLAFVILGALAAATLAGTFLGFFGGLLFGVIAGLVPIAILSLRKSRRRDKFLNNLPDTLQLLAGSLRAGYAVLQAIDSVAKESHPPTSEEFGRVLTEARLGMPLEDALEAMADRVDSDDFRWVVLAINIQREVGGNLAELLDTVAEVLREREMLRRQIKVLSAEGKLSAIILIALPIFLTLYLVLVRREYISTLVTSGIFGWGLIIGASFLMLVGTFWIYKMIQIEV